MQYMEKNDLIYEKILIAKLKAGDKSAFSSIFSFYYANLVSFANLFMRDSNSSEEIVQDIFVHVWEKPWGSYNYFLSKIISAKNGSEPMLKLDQTPENKK